MSCSVSRPRWWIVVVVFAAAGAAASADAAIITFTHSGTGAGTIDGNPFGASNFTITAVGNTDNRIAIGGDVFSIDHTSALISIVGVGEFQFLIPTRTFVNQTGRVVGFSNGGPAGLDLFNGPFETQAFATWDMLSSIGPLSGGGFLTQWNDQTLTSGGALIFQTDPNTTATFTAVIPAPGTAAMAVGIGALARRRRRS